MDNNFQKILLSELKCIFGPLVESAKDRDSLLLFFDKMGWSLNKIIGVTLANNTAPFLTDLNTLTTAVTAIDQYITTPPQTLAEFEVAIKKIEDAVKAVKDLPSSVTGFNPSALQAMPGEILNKLFVYYLFDRYRRVYDFLRLLKIIENNPVTPITNGTYVQVYDSEFSTINFNRLKNFIANPASYLNTTFLTNPISTIADAKSLASQVFPHLSRLLASLGFAVSYGRGSGPLRLTQAEEDQLDTAMTFTYQFFNSTSSLTDKVGATIAFIPASTNGGKAGVLIIPFGNLSYFGNFGNWNVNFTATGGLKGILIDGSSFQSILTATSPFLFIGCHILKNNENGNAFLIGSTTGTRLRIGDFSISSELKLSNSIKEYGIEIELQKGEIIIKPGDGDNFLSKVLPAQGLKVEFNLTLGWDNLSGFYFKGAGGLDLRLPIHKTILDVITIDDVLFQIKANNTDIKVNLATSATLLLGPMKGVVKDVGLSALFTFPQNGGNLGPANVDFGFKPPTGLGLTMKSEAITGGGFLSFDKAEGRYVGALELSIKDKISLKAIGILTTKLPGGKQGYSLLLLITAEFQPIPLGFGFTLNGVGGLIALHRRMNTQALRDAVFNHTLDDILFPKNPVANINNIISSLETTFPIQEGRYTFGPMAIIAWGSPTMISIDLGLFFELPDANEFALIGIIRTILPEKSKPILKLQIAFAGIINFEKKYITFDASLFDSTLYGLPLSGDMVFRMRWGDQPTFVLSVGGFHPKFQVPPLNIPAMRRLSMSLVKSDNPRLTLQAYIAITSNTVQFGAAVDFYWKITSNIDVKGHLGFDALFYFAPFRFEATMTGNLDVRWRGDAKLSIYFNALIEGPTPWHINGKAGFKVLGVEYEKQFDKTFGQKEITTLQDEDVLPKLVTALQDKKNWQATLSKSVPLLVTVRELNTPNSEVVVHPQGNLAVSQKVVPLNVDISRFGNYRPKASGYSYFNLDIAYTSNPADVLLKSNLREFFAPNEFFELSESERLSRPSFELFNSGVQVGGANNALVTCNAGGYREVEYQYEKIVMDSRYEPLRYSVPFPVAIAERVYSGGNATANSPLALSQKAKSSFAPQDKVVSKGKTYALAYASDLTQHGAQLVTTQTEALALLQRELELNPALEGSLQVVNKYELNN